MLNYVCTCSPCGRGLAPRLGCLCTGVEPPGPTGSEFLASFLGPPWDAILDRIIDGPNKTEINKDVFILFSTYPLKPHLSSAGSMYPRKGMQIYFGYPRPKVGYLVTQFQSREPPIRSLSNIWRLLKPYKKTGKGYGTGTEHLLTLFLLYVHSKFVWQQAAEDLLYTLAR